MIQVKRVQDVFQLNKKKISVVHNNLFDTILCVGTRYIVYGIFYIVYKLYIQNNIL